MVGSIWLNGITVALISSTQVKSSRGLCALWLAGAGWLVRSPGMCVGLSQWAQAAAARRRPGVRR